MSRYDITKVTGDSADRLGVRRFAKAMADKLDKKARQGRGGWNDPGQCDTAELWEMLGDHVRKGDPVDLANFAMMIWNRQNPKGLP